MDAWIILIAFMYFVQYSYASEMNIPYDVVLPPDGDGESLPPVIMMHGLMDWRKTWNQLAPEIAKNTGRKVYAYDSTNHGENKWSDVFNYNVTLSDLEQFIQEHNIMKAVLVGHSIGGKTAMLYALSQPEKVEKIVVEEMIAGKPNPAIINFITKLFLIAKLALTEFSAVEDEASAKSILIRFAERIFAEEQRKALNRDLMMEWAPIIKKGDKHEYLANIDLFLKMLSTQTIADWDVDLTGVYDGDALFIDGVKSPFNMSYDERIHKHFPKATLIKFEANHVVHFPFQKEFEREVTKFINTKSTSQ